MTNPYWPEHPLTDAEIVQEAKKAHAEYEARAFRKPEAKEKTSCS